MAQELTIEHQRLDETTQHKADWKGWGPYLSERAWGTVREDYSADGEAWAYFPHDHARSRAYRWSEDGIGGICDRDQILCFAPAFWNGQDPILKERLFGLSGPEGNHGEDVKEYYYYLESTPTHSYLKMLYKYPQAAFPYQELVRENTNRSRREPEFELLDTGVFRENRYFDLFLEYAKADPRDLLIRIQAFNRGPDPAPLHLLPQLWFRNTWSWGLPGASRPSLRWAPPDRLEARHSVLGNWWLHLPPGHDPRILCTENETNKQRLFGVPNDSPYVKDGIHEAVVQGQAQAVHPNREGTKAAIQYRYLVPPGQSVQLQLRLADRSFAAPFEGFEALFERRREEADGFYRSVQPKLLSAEERAVQRQAFAGLLWSKQWYHFDVHQWLQGDPAGPPPPAAHRSGRNSSWRHLHCNSILSMPDKWEYPWFAAWDMAFHCIPIALVDPELAKRQLTLMLRDWYLHPNGQMAAYEWSFGDVNPPVHAWACWRVYKIEKKIRGRGDTRFLERAFHKLLLNFTWWVNRKDAQGNNVFQGGFLGMDNIGVFDRSAPLPTGGHLEQSDSTSWMAMYCLNLMTIALELAHHNEVYEDIATKFFEHYMYIAQAMNNLGGEGLELWDEEDGFFYDVLHLPRDGYNKLKIRSMVGLVPLLAVEVLEPEFFAQFPRFTRRMEWFMNDRPEMASLVSRWWVEGSGQRHLFALLRGHRMKRVLKRLLDPEEFLSPYGIRALSKHHAAEPYRFQVDGEEYTVPYEPGESSTRLFGGNSNWRGPVWMPVNYLLIESLQKFHHYYSDDFRVECPTGSGRLCSLREIADELANRLIGIFLRDPQGKRPFHGGQELFNQDPHFREHLLFYEYFHGDSGAGLGASHQTGWTALVAKLLQQRGEARQRAFGQSSPGDTLRLTRPRSNQKQQAKSRPLE